MTFVGAEIKVTVLKQLKNVVSYHSNVHGLQITLNRTQGI